MVLTSLLSDMMVVVMSAHLNVMSAQVAERGGVERRYINVSKKDPVLDTNPGRRRFKPIHPQESFQKSAVSVEICPGTLRKLQYDKLHQG